MIEITGIDLRRFAKKVYELSPATSEKDTLEALSDTVMGVVMDSGGLRGWKKYVLDMKVIKGRACNMTVFESNEGRWFIQDTWFRHSRLQLKQLLDHCGVTADIKEN